MNPFLLFVWNWRARRGEWRERWREWRHGGAFDVVERVKALDPDQR